MSNKNLTPVKIKESKTKISRNWKYRELKFDISNKGVGGYEKSKDRRRSNIFMGHATGS